MSALATAQPDAGGVRSRAGTKADAFRFRQRLYWWRKATCSVLADPESSDARAAREWLRRAVGDAAAEKDWLDLTIFEVHQQEDGKHFVLARLRPAMFGPEEPSAADIEAALTLLRNKGL